MMSFLQSVREAVNDSGAMRLEQLLKNKSGPRNTKEPSPCVALNVHSGGKEG